MKSISDREYNDILRILKAVGSRKADTLKEAEMSRRARQIIRKWTKA